MEVKRLVAVETANILQPCSKNSVNRIFNVERSRLSKNAAKIY